MRASRFFGRKRARAKPGPFPRKELSGLHVKQPPHASVHMNGLREKEKTTGPLPANLRGLPVPPPPPRTMNFLRRDSTSRLGPLRQNREGPPAPARSRGLPHSPVPARALPNGLPCANSKVLHVYRHRQTPGRALCNCPPRRATWPTQRYISLNAFYSRPGQLRLADKSRRCRPRLGQPHDADDGENRIISSVDGGTATKDRGSTGGCCGRPQGAGKRAVHR